MGAAGYAIDEVTDQLVSAAGYMLIPAYIFPSTKAIDTLMPVGKGGPGTLAEGSRAWQDGAAALGRARANLASVTAGLGGDDWTGDDRTLFDTRIEQLGQQLDIASNYSQVVGATLAGLAVPLAAYGGVCLGIGGVLLAEALFVEALTASLVGDLGPSEAAYAAGCVTAATCLAVLTGVVAGYGIIMEAAAIGLTIGTGLEVDDLRDHGDEKAADNFVQAEVDGLGEVATNLEGFAADAVGDFVAGRATRGMPEVTTAEKAIKKAVEGAIGGRVGDVNSAVVDGVSGEGPGTVLKDLSGYGGEIDAAQDLADGGGPPELPPDTTHYDLPAPAPVQPAPVQPIPPAPPGGPHVTPLPNAVPGDAQVVPAGTAAINGTDGNTATTAPAGTRDAEEGEA